MGRLLGGPGLGTKGVLALATAQRNIAAALVVGGKEFDDPKVLVMIVVVAVVGLLILMPLARSLGLGARKLQLEQLQVQDGRVPRVWHKRTVNYDESSFGISFLCFDCFIVGC